MAIARITIKDENELRKIVIDDVSVVESGLTVICDNMPIDSSVKIDVLCHDEDGQLVVIKMSIKETDNMFFEGLKDIAHVNNVKPMLKFSYKDFKISESKSPRLVFLAPSFSEQLISVVRQMQGIQIDLYVWEYFGFDDKKALHLEPVWVSEATKAKPRRSKPEKPKPLKKTEEEPEKVTEEVIVPLEEAAPELPKKESREKTKKKSIFSI